MNIFLEDSLLVENGTAALGTDLTGENRGNGEKGGNYGKNGMDGKNSNSGMAARGEREEVTQGDSTEGNEGNEGMAGEGTVGGTPTAAGETPALPGDETAGNIEAIGAGANPMAKVQFASGEMPSPQADAAGFYGSQP